MEKMLIIRITNHEWKWGKRNRHELVELAQLFKMVWKVGKVVIGGNGV